MDSFNDLPGKCAMVLDTLKENRQELSWTKLKLHNLHAELVTTNEITEVLFHLVGEMRTLLCMNNQEQGDMKILESVIDSAAAQLSVQSLKMDCKALRHENSKLRDALQKETVREPKWHIKLRAVQWWGASVNQEISIWQLAKGQRRVHGWHWGGTELAVVDAPKAVV